jgi:hypothetical protein
MRCKLFACLLSCLKTEAFVRFCLRVCFPANSVRHLSVCMHVCLPANKLRHLCNVVCMSACLLKKSVICRMLFAWLLVSRQTQTFVCCCLHAGLPAYGIRHLFDFVCVVVPANKFRHLSDVVCMSACLQTKADICLFLFACVPCLQTNSGSCLILFVCLPVCRQSQAFVGFCLHVCLCLNKIRHVLLVFACLLLFIRTQTFA